MQRVGSIADNDSGRAAVDFAETTGRYLLLKWTPAESGSTFSIAEIAAFGNQGRANLVAANTSVAPPEEGPNGDDKMTFDGKDFKDLGDAKDMPAEGPAEGPGSPLPPPPAFVFTPIVVPASP
jgi:hypothetical protein